MKKNSTIQYGLRQALFLSSVILFVGTEVVHAGKKSSVAYHTINTMGEYRNAVGQSKPVVIMYSSPSCGPCRRMEPDYNAVAAQQAGKISFYKLDTSSKELKNHVKQSGVKGVPTIIYFNQGKEVMRDRRGCMTRAELNTRIKAFEKKVQNGGKTSTASKTQKRSSKTVSKQQSSGSKLSNRIRNKYCG